jgi:riboflavin synthase
MFTGLIQDVGTIKSITRNTEGAILSISTTLAPEIKIDDSVAVNGCCLTATKVGQNFFEVQAVHVTLDKTSVGKLNAGDSCNLELALKASDRLGGHIVQGHVNGLGRVQKIEEFGKNWEISVELPSDLARYVISEGSICIDGISLTVARLDKSLITVSIIPHTLKNTNLHCKKVGSLVNIEVDVLAKYVEKFILGDKSESSDKLDKKKVDWVKLFKE